MKGSPNTEQRRVAPIPADRCRANLRGISIREVRADDGDRIANAFRALGPQTIYRRFFFPKRDLSDEELRRLTECDNVRDAVLVATAASGDEEIIVGLGNYAQTGASADVAFAVAEDYQGRGIASELLRQLAQIARRSGISRFERGRARRQRADAEGVSAQWIARAGNAGEPCRAPGDASRRSVERLSHGTSTERDLSVTTC